MQSPGTCLDIEFARIKLKKGLYKQLLGCLCRGRGRGGLDAEIFQECVPRHQMASYVDSRVPVNIYMTPEGVTGPCLTPPKICAAAGVHGMAAGVGSFEDLLHVLQP